MSVALVTGSGGLIGSQATRHFAGLGLGVVGVDNDTRGQLFGPDGSVAANLGSLAADVPTYEHHDLDVRDRDGLDALWRKYGRDVTLVLHTAAQPAHDSADPTIDWDINATGTMNVLEATRRHAPDAVVVVMSTIKVYGPHPNRLPFVELATRFDVDSQGIDETMSIDAGTHSVFGASKTAADIMAQEYGHYLDLRTVILRGGCLTGAGHAAIEMHGFLGHLVRCVATGQTYRIIGYGGKQVRDQIHAHDVATAIEAIWRDPPEPGAVFNLGGGRGRDVSILEALTLTQELVRKVARVELAGARRGDHRWWVTDMTRFRTRYPDWRPTYQVADILREIYRGARWV